MKQNRKKPIFPPRLLTWLQSNRLKTCRLLILPTQRSLSLLQHSRPFKDPLSLRKKRAKTTIRPSRLGVPPGSMSQAQKRVSDTFPQLPVSCRVVGLSHYSLVVSPHSRSQLGGLFRHHLALRRRRTTNASSCRRIHHISFRFPIPNHPKNPNDHAMTYRTTTMTLCRRLSRESRLYQ